MVKLGGERREVEAAQTRILDAKELYYDADYSAEDLPAFVRGGSSLRRRGEWWIIAQDDINALALVRADASRETRAVLLPRGAGGCRTFGPSLGNKSDKMDLEASVVLPDGRYVAFGSGSTPRRDTLVVLDEAEQVRLVEGASWYEALRAQTGFSGTQLNIEGALIVDDELWLFQRGNSLESPNAIGVLALADFVAWLDGAPPPTLSHIQHLSLGSINGVPYTFTDAERTPDGRVYFLGSAEDTDDAYEDGALHGTILARFAGTDLRTATVTSTRILESDGTPSLRKIEGLSYDSGGGDTNAPLRFWAVTDDDDEADPCELLLLEWR